MTVFSGLIETARSDPDRVAIEHGDEHWTRGDLLVAAAAVVTGPLAGLRPGATVALMAGNSPAFIAGFLGIAMAGGVAAVLDPASTDDRVKRALALLDPAAILADRTHLCQVPSAVLLEDVTRRSQGGVATLPPLPAIGGGAPFYLGFTSGTSGRPKAFRRSHASWRASFEAGRRAFGLSPSDRVLVPGSLTHSLFLYAALDAIDMGATVLLERRFDAQTLARNLGRHPVDRLWLVPTMAVSLAETGGGPHRDVATVLFGGARLDRAVEHETARLFPNAEIIEFYGASELSFVAWRSSRDTTPAGSVGRPFLEVEVEIRDELGHAVATGETGTIFVRSPFLSQGYVIGGDGMGFRRDAEGFATVGDQGRLDGSGHLHLGGREGEMIITGGLNVYPAEIEQALVAALALDGVMVTGLPDPRWGTAVAAILKPKDGGPRSLAEVAAALEGRIEAWKRPRRVFLADDLPLTPAGKIARGRLRSWLETDEARAAELT